MKTVLATTAVLVSLATGALAQDLPAEVKARQGQFRIMAINLGILGGMAKGQTAYDAAAAQAAADSIVGITMVNQPPLWKEGTDSMSIDGTRAMPGIWDNIPDVLAKWAALGTAAAELQQVAGTGKDAIGPMLGKVGGACKACHDTYREPR